VVVIDDHLPSRRALTAAIVGAEGMVVAESGSARSAPDLMVNVRPDVAILAVGLGDGDGVSAAEAVMTTAPCPIVLFTSHCDDEIIERAAAAGVMGFLLKPLRPEEVPPVLDLAIARFGEIQDLRHRLDARKVVERAKGLLTRRGLSEEEAYQTLRTAAMNQRRTIADIARALLVAESIRPGQPRGTTDRTAR
jgi:AmiR/NasT family two-component response regulator